MELHKTFLELRSVNDIEHKLNQAAFHIGSVWFIFTNNIKHAIIIQQAAEFCAGMFHVFVDLKHLCGKRNSLLQISDNIVMQFFNIRRGHLR